MANPKQNSPEALEGIQRYDLSIQANKTYPGKLVVQEGTEDEIVQGIKEILRTHSVERNLTRINIWNHFIAENPRSLALMDETLFEQLVKLRNKLYDAETNNVDLIENDGYGGDEILEDISNLITKVTQEMEAVRDSEITIDSEEESGYFVGDCKILNGEIIEDNIHEPSREEMIERDMIDEDDE